MLRRSILSVLREDCEQLARFKVRSLMRELELLSKQPGSHTYKPATFERLDIPNILSQEAPSMRVVFAQATVGLLHAPEHESAEQLLRQLAYGACISQPKTE